MTLVPDSWSRKYCSEYFEFQNISFDLQENWSKERGYLHNLLRKKVKQWPKKQLILFMLSMRIMNTADNFLGKKDYVSMQEGEHKQKRLVLCNLHELFIAFKERNQDVKIEFSKFCIFCLKWLVIAGSSRTHSVCVCATHQNTILLVDTLNWEVTCKDLVNKVVCDPSNRECMMHHCTNCQEQTHYINFWKRSSVVLILIFNFTTHNGKLQTASLVTVTSTCEE